MARRSKRDNSLETAKLITALIFLLALGLSGGDLLQAAELLPLLLIACIVLAVIGFVLYFLFKINGPAKVHPGFTRTSTTYQTHVGSTTSGAGPVIQVSAHPNNNTPIQPNPRPEPVPQKRFTRELLDQLEWRRFEMLVQALFQAEGQIASRIRAGADGGIDLALRESPQGPVTAIVQCKAWKAYTVGVKPIRELFGVMHAEGVPRAYFFTSGQFTSEALAFAKNKPLDLIDGNNLLLRLNKMEQEKRDSILSKITTGDYKTPTCPSCDTKMLRRTSRNGEFWGCRSYPRCKQTFNIRK